MGVSQLVVIVITLIIKGKTHILDKVLLKTKYTGITVKPFTWDKSPSLPENFDVSVATALDNFNLLFKPEIFSMMRDHTHNYAIFKQDEIWRIRNNPDFLDSMWQKTTLEKSKVLFQMNILT